MSAFDPKRTSGTLNGTQLNSYDGLSETSGASRQWPDQMTLIIGEIEPRKRTVAVQMLDPHTKAVMLQIAQDYEKLAERAEQRAVTHSPTG